MVVAIDLPTQHSPRQQWWGFYCSPSAPVHLPTVAMIPVFLQGTHWLQNSVAALIAADTDFDPALTLLPLDLSGLLKLALLIAQAGLAGHRLVINQIQPVQPIVLWQCCPGVAAEGYC